MRVKFTDLEGRHRLTTLKLDLQYWPTFTLESDAAGEWARTMHPPTGTQHPYDAQP